MLSPRLNTQIINTFLEQFSTTIPKGEQAVMVWDGAGFHTAKALRVPANVALVPLPQASVQIATLMCTGKEGHAATISASSGHAGGNAASST